MSVAPSIAKPQRWLVGSAAATCGSMPLYCFSHAGGAPGEYARWSLATNRLSIFAVQLPGRGSRMGEAPILRMEEAVRRIVEGVDFRSPAAFFGHSFGGLLAFEVARALRAAGLPLPAHLFVSSSPPPPHRAAFEPVHRLSDEELHAWVRAQWGPLPEAITDSPTLLAGSLTTLRQDIEILSNYEYRDLPPLDCPITTFVGDSERIDMTGWRRHSTMAVQHQSLMGNHFYFRGKQEPLLQIIANIVNAEEET